MPAWSAVYYHEQKNTGKSPEEISLCYLYIKYKLTALAFGIVTAAAFKHIKYIAAIFIISIIAGIQTAV